MKNFRLMFETYNARQYETDELMTLEECVKKLISLMTKMDITQYLIYDEDERVTFTEHKCKNTFWENLLEEAKENKETRW